MLQYTYTCWYCMWVCVCSGSVCLYVCVWSFPYTPQNVYCFNSDNIANASVNILCCVEDQSQSWTFHLSIILDHFTIIPHLAIVCPSWVGQKKTWITFERKQLRIRNLHRQKARAKVVRNISSVYSKTGEKVLFPNSIQKSMGIEKTTGFPLKTRPLLVTHYGSIHRRSQLLLWVFYTVLFFFITSSH